jgi:hypothetical protein
MPDEALYARAGRMTMQPKYPGVVAVRPLERKQLDIHFRDGSRKVYDCSPLLVEDAFAPLAAESLFRQVRVEPHGYAVSWDEDIDLAGSELWLNGEAVAEGVSVD